MRSPITAVNGVDCANRGSLFTPRRVAGESRKTPALRLVAGLVLACLGTGCMKRVEAAPDLTKKFAGGHVLTLGGPKKYSGSEVQVEVRFRDGAPNCTMRGAVQHARDDTHRWVWLEPEQGCPEWLTGRWWAELASGGGGWYVQDISTQAVEESR